jgi:hypothetical protein
MTKEQARHKVHSALRRGDIVRPASCQRCGAGGSTSDGRAYIHAHHHLGYESPLDVEWLCPKCHFAEDPRPAREQNGRAKLTESEVAAIRREFCAGATGGHPDGGARWLARKYNVSDRTIGRVVRFENWIDAAMSV